jgi:hypothetical protein
MNKSANEFKSNLRKWRLYLTCGHTDITFVNPKQDPTKWAGYSFCEGCDKRVLIAKIAETNIPDN